MCLTSCSSEEPTVNTGGKDGEGLGYLSFKIQSQTRSRAQGDTPLGNEIFNNGDEQEYAICPNMASNVAYFFDDKGQFYGMTTLQPYNNPDEMDHGATHDDTYPETYYTYVSRRRNAPAEKPTRVLVVLNGVPSTLEALADELENAGESALTVAQKKAYNTFEGKNYIYGIYNYGNAKYFTMSNSAFTDDSKTLTSIADVQVCSTAEAALANPVTVYVERQLAKYQLAFTTADGNKELTSDNVNIFLSPKVPAGGNPNSVKVNYVADYQGEDSPNLDYPSYTTIDWQAYIVNWTISGLEKTANLVKNIANNIEYGTGFDWDAPALHRSYWGESPDYSTNIGFTTQYRNITYDPEYNSLSQSFSGNTQYDPAREYDQLNTLHYASFNDVKNRGQYKYTAERTYSSITGRKGNGPYSYDSHYLIAAQLVFPNIDHVDATNPIKYETQQLAYVDDKYYAYNYFWKDPKAYIRFAYRRMATQVTDGRTHNMVIKALNNGNPIAVLGVSDGYLYKDNQGTKLTVKEAGDYFELVSAQTVHGDGKQVISPIEGNKLYIKTKEADGTNPAVYTELTADQITAMIYSFTEPVKHFSEGKMYYAIPVQHNRGFSDPKYTVTVNRDMPAMVIGQFGAVRNHWYRLTVSSISNIGISVDNPDQPIIPDPEDDYYVAVEIVVLPWNIINNGEIGL